MEADLPQITAIWNHEVLCTDATTDTEPRDPGAQRERLARHPAGYPIVVAVTAAEGLTFGALSPYRPKPAFARTLTGSDRPKRGLRAADGGNLILAELT